jgi:Rrf2 family protein
VKITVSIEYALQALAEISAEGSERVAARDIAARQDIPIKFLEAILRKLTVANILNSTRGPQGGYQLAKSPDEITVAEIIRIIEGPLAAVGDSAPESTKYRRSAKHITEVWIATRVALRDVLERITLAQIIEGEFDPKIKQAIRRKDAWSRR